MILTRVQLDAALADGKPPEAGVSVVLQPKCHARGGVTLDYASSVLTVRCAICRQTVARILVAE